MSKKKRAKPAKPRGGDPILWSTLKVAKERGTSPQNIRRHIIDGKLPVTLILGVRPGEVHYGIDPEDALRWSPAPRGRPREKTGPARKKIIRARLRE